MPTARPEERRVDAAVPPDEVSDSTIHVVMSESSGGAAPAPSGGGGLRDSGPIMRVEPASPLAMPLASGGDAATPDAAAPATDAESAAESAEPDGSWLVAVDLVKQMRAELTPGGAQPVPIPPGAKAPRHAAARLSSDARFCVRADAAKWEEDDMRLFFATNGVVRPELGARRKKTTAAHRRQLYD